MIRSPRAAAALAASLLAASAMAQPAPAPDPRQQAAALIDQARPLAAAKDWARVKPIAEQAVAADAANAQAHALLGLALHGTRKWGAALRELEKAAQLGIEPKVVARAAAECADRRKDKARQAKWWLQVARDEKELNAALKAAHAAESPAEAYELAQSLGKLPASELAPFARAELAAGAPAKAAPLFDQAATAAPNDVGLALEAARAHLAAKDVDGAEQRVRAAYTKFPNEPGVLLASAELASARGDAATERKILEKLLEKNPKYGPGQLRLGKLLQTQGDLAGARARYSAAVAASPNDGEAHRLLAEASFAAGDKKTALDEARAAQKLAPKDAAANLILGRALVANGDLTAAIAPLEAGRKLAPGDALLELGAAYLAAKQPAKARSAASEALKRDASPSRAHELQGDIAMADGRGQDAVKEYAQSAGGREKDVPFQVKQAAAADLAGDTDAAAAALDHILAANPGDAKASIARAKIYRAQKVPEKAAALLTPLAAKKDPEVLTALAQARIEAGDLAGAQEAAAAAGDRPAAHDVLGRVLYAQGKRKEAQPHLEAAGADASGDALIALADLKLAAGQKDAARALVKRAQKAGAARLAVALARLQAKDGDLNGAEKTISAYLAAHPDDGDALSTGADIAYDRAQFSTARDRFEKASAKAVMTPAAQGRLCDLRVKDGAFADAKDACEKAIAGGSDAPAVHASYGLALYKTGDKAKAKSELKLNASSDDIATHAALGAIAADEGDDKTALAEYERVLKQKKDHVEANMVSGRLLEKKGQHKAASERLAKAFAARADDAQLGADLAKAQLNAGNLPGAQRTLAQIRTDALAPAALHGLKGRVENGLGNYKRAHEEYQKALQAKPNDAELLALDGENYLKLPNYEKAIASLEQAAAADPSRLDIATQLTRLYSETGQTQKAAATLTKVEALEKKQIDEQRKELDPKLVKRLAIGDDFKNGGKDSSLPGLAVGLRNMVAGDLSRSPKILVIDTKHREEVAKERDRIASQQDVSQKELEALAAKEQAPQAVISGLYILDGDNFSLSVEVHDLNHNVLASATEDGARKDYALVEKKAALKIMDRLVSLTPDERAQLQRLEGVGSPNLDSFALASEAQAAAQSGDVRKATELYQRARETDQGNARALIGLEQSLAEATKKNQLAIPAPQTLGEVSEAEKEMFRRTLTDKLSGLKGLRVIEQERVKEVDAELDRIMDKDRDNIDPKSIDLQAIGKKLAATVLVRSTMQKEGDRLALSASLVDITDQKLLTGAQVEGPAANRQKLQSDLAKQIVQRLRGEPTDEEKAALESIMKEDEYQQKMAELQRLLDKEKLTASKPVPQEVKPAVAIAEPPKAAPVADRAPVKLTQEEVWDVFSLSARLGRASPYDDGRNLYGLVLSHKARRWDYLRMSLLMDLESTKLTGRPADEKHAGWYALGLDFTVPIQVRGTGLFLGASANFGLAQAQQPGAGVQSGTALTVDPHAGIALAYHGIGITGDVGYRVPVVKSDAASNAGLSGFFVQAGIRTETIAGGYEGPGQLAIGYTARFFVPNSTAVASRFASGTIGGGSMLTHGLSIGGSGEDSSNALYLGFASQSDAGGTSLKRYEASWQYLWKAFGSARFFDPYLGFRLGVAGFSGYDFDSTKLSAVVAPQAGLDLQIARAFAVRLGGSYDWLSSGDLKDGAHDLQGWSVDAGASLRF